MLVYVLIGILLFMVGLLLVPFRFYGQGQITEDIRLEWGLAWAGGLVSVHWKLPPGEQSGAVVRLGPWVTTRASGPAPTASADKQPSPKKSGPKANWDVIRAILDKQVGQEIMSFMGNLWRSLRLRCHLAGDYGTDDPALTAYIAALIALINNNSQKLDLHPQFTRQEVNINGIVQGQLRPGIVLWDTSRFMLKRPIRKIWWTMLRNGKNSDRRNDNV